MANVHPELIHSLVAAVLETEGNEEPYTWTEVAEQPLAIAVQNSESLPTGVFQTATSYPLESFSLSEKATADLAAYTKLTGGAITAMRFTSELVEQARLLGAAHSFGWGSLIVGQDVGDRLAEDAPGWPPPQSPTTTRTQATPMERRCRTTRRSERSV